MTRARGIVLAGLVAAGVAAAHAAYRWWPVRHGAEVCVPAAIYRQPAEVGVVLVRVAMARVELDVPHEPPAVNESFEPVRTIGGWWIAGGDARANARALRGRSLYLQLRNGEPALPGGPPLMRPASASDAVVPGATNVAGIVIRVREDGYLWLDFSTGWIAVPPAVEANARPLNAEGPRPPDAGAIPPAADPGVCAVLRVLPSGRATMTGLIAQGARY